MYYKSKLIILIILKDFFLKYSIIMRIATQILKKKWVWWVDYLALYSIDLSIMSWVLSTMWVWHSILDTQKKNWVLMYDHYWEVLCMFGFLYDYYIWLIIRWFYFIFYLVESVEAKTRRVANCWLFHSNNK